jgi:hypothetical protein
MPAKTKTRHTKEQVFQLLDRAIEKEEALAQKVAMLEKDLAECRKKAENPRHELDERAIPSSKMSFRLDYYCLSPEGPLKGIVEELSLRQAQPFEGSGFRDIERFVSQFLPEGLAAEPLPFPPDIVGTRRPKSKAKNRAPVPAEEEPGEPILLESGRFEVLHCAPQGGNAQIQIAILPEGLEMLWEETCALSLLVESLEASPRKNFVHQEVCSPVGSPFLVPPQAMPLGAPGVYRVSVSLVKRNSKTPIFYEGKQMIALN